MFPELLDEGYEPFEIPNALDAGVGDDADTAVDVTETIEAKIEALRCHKSQIHDWPVDEWVKRARQGPRRPGRHEYAETFRTFRLKDD